MQRTVRGLVAALTLLATTGCGSGYKIGYDYDLATNFRVYRSYSWLDPSNKATSDRWGQAIRLAVTSELVTRGFEPLPRNADLFVSYKMEPPAGSSGPAENLELQFVDAKSKLVVWRGWADGAVKDLSIPPPKEDMQKMITDIMTQYPPRAK